MTLTRPVERMNARLTGTDAQQPVLVPAFVAAVLDELEQRAQEEEISGGRRRLPGIDWRRFER